MTQADAVGEQLELLRRQVRGRRPKAPPPLAETDPVASVALDIPLPHLDRPFDYAVPQPLSDAAAPGSRVRVRFAGQDVDAYVLERKARSDHEGRLSRIRTAPGGEPVLDPAVLTLARAVADRYAGTLADVLRLAVPPRHAASEKEPTEPASSPPSRPDPGLWRTYRGGTAFLMRLAAGSAPRAVWTALPGRQDDGWPAALAVAAGTALNAGRGSVIVVPDHRDVARVDDALTRLLGEGHHVRLTADSGPAARYAAFLRLRRGAVRIAVGTRAAAFAPVQDLGLVVCWDDADDLLAEPRAPYPHAREVLALRAEQAGAAALLGSLSRSAAAQQLVTDGWARPVVAERSVVRRRTPVVTVTGDDDLRDPAARAARLPSLALRTVREALAAGPVLVQVPRVGYLPALACQTCREPARCLVCSGPLALAHFDAAPSCRWCARPAAAWMCPHCSGRRLRSVVVGAARTAEELGRAFPGTLVRPSGGSAPVLDMVPDRPQVVVATPGAEPMTESGYAAALLVDTWALLSRPDLAAAEEALRRWFAAASLVRPSSEGGRVVVVGDSSLTPLQALVRWDPAGHAERELAERASLRLPPAALLAEIRGDRQAVDVLLDAVRRDDAVPAAALEVFGPLPVPSTTPRNGDAGTPRIDTMRALVRAPRPYAQAVATALAAARARLSASKQARLPRVQIDPQEIG